jgi:hypothetical protein
VAFPAKSKRVARPRIAIYRPTGRPGSEHQNHGTQQWRWSRPLRRVRPRLEHRIEFAVGIGSALDRPVKTLHPSSMLSSRLVWLWPTHFWVSGSCRPQTRSTITRRSSSMNSGKYDAESHNDSLSGAHRRTQNTFAFHRCSKVVSAERSSSNIR